MNKISTGEIMIKTFERILIIVFCFSLLAGCGSENRGGGCANISIVIGGPKIKLHEIGMEVKRDQLSPSQKQLINQIDEKKMVDQDLLLEIILEIHREEFLKSGFQPQGSEVNPPFMGHFDPLLNSISQDTGPHEFKVAYEKNLLDLHGGQAMKYNKAHTSVFSPLLANRMQCYSGTVLFHLLYRRLVKSPSSYFKLNPVFIYEDGHVLPGYMSKVDSQWHLFGIETTLSGLAKKIYGPTSGLRGVRVVDAHLTFGIEALKGHITNRASVLKVSLEKTANLYDIPLDKTEGSLSNASISLEGTLGSGTTVSDTSSYLNSSLFSFGDSSQVSGGDQERESVDEFTAEPGSSGSRILSDPGNWRKESTSNNSHTRPGKSGNRQLSHPNLKNGAAVEEEPPIIYDDEIPVHYGDILIIKPNISQLLSVDGYKSRSIFNEGEITTVNVEPIRKARAPRIKDFPRETAIHCQINTSAFFGLSDYPGMGIMEYHYEVDVGHGNWIHLSLRGVTFKDPENIHSFRISYGAINGFCKSPSFLAFEDWSYDENGSYVRGNEHIPRGTLGEYRRTFGETASVELVKCEVKKDRKIEFMLCL